MYRFLLWVMKDAFGVPGGWKGLTPPTVLVGGTADPGSGDATGWVAADAIFATATGVPSGLGNAAAAGASTAAPRLDHVHKRDVRVFVDGVEVGVRNAIDFIGGVATDDPGLDMVHVTLDSDDALYLGFVM